MMIPEEEIPFLADCRAICRYLILHGKRRRRKGRIPANHLQAQLSIGLLLNMILRVDGFNADDKSMFLLHNQDRVGNDWWSLSFSLHMKLGEYSRTLIDHRGRKHEFDVPLMSFMPGYFEEFDHFRKNGLRYNQNSLEMAAFYILKFGSFTHSSLKGSREKFENDLTLARLHVGEVIEQMDALKK